MTNSSEDKNSQKKYSEWLDNYPQISRFINDAPLEGSSEDKWTFYYEIQEALKKMPTFIHKDSHVSNKAEHYGPIIIESGVKILPGVFIEGPVFIGKNSFIGNSSLIRPGTFLASDVVVGNNCYHTAAVIGPKTGTFHFSGISRTLIERNSRITAFVVTATTQPDLEPITKNLPNDIDAPRKRGCLIGENSYVGAHCLINPGLSIGNNCFVGPYCYVKENILDNKRVETTLELKLSDNNFQIEEAPAPPQIAFNTIKRTP